MVFLFSVQSYIIRREEMVMKLAIADDNNADKISLILIPFYICGIISPVYYWWLCLYEGFKKRLFIL